MPLVVGEKPVRPLPDAGAQAGVNAVAAAQSQKGPLVELEEARAAFLAEAGKPHSPVVGIFE
jgi:hypothetical protein